MFFNVTNKAFMVLHTFIYKISAITNSNTIITNSWITLKAKRITRSAKSGLVG